MHRVRGGFAFGSNDQGTGQGTAGGNGSLVGDWQRIGGGLLEWHCND